MRRKSKPVRETIEAKALDPRITNWHLDGFCTRSFTLENKRQE